MDANELSAQRRSWSRAEAAEWWVRMQAAEPMPRAEREQFIDWLRESPMHVAEMLRVAQVHGSLEQFQHWARIATGGAEIERGTVVPLHASLEHERIRGSNVDEPAPAARARRQRPRRVRAWWTIAASMALAAIATTWSTVAVQSRAQTIRTERGERREVALADGSVVQVDPATDIRVKFQEHERRVLIKKGRALFRVAKNPQRPFLVQVDETVVRAVGTAFGVERRDLGTVVTVAEGRVAVLRGQDSWPTASEEPRPRADSGEIAPRASAGTAGSRQQGGRSAGASLSESPIFLDAGQQLTVQRTGSAEPVRKVDASRELAWAEGRLVFQDTPVTEVIAQFNRYNRVQLHVVDPALARRSISGVFDAADPESFIEFVALVTPIQVRREQDLDITIAAAR
jgi:transmembrane sensor